MTEPPTVSVEYINAPQIFTRYMGHSQGEKFQIIFGHKTGMHALIMGIK